MRTFGIRIGCLIFDVFLLRNVDEYENVKALLISSGVSDTVAHATATDLTCDPPKILGVAFTELNFVVIAKTTDVYLSGQVVFHELGHCLAKKLGQDEKSEAVANLLAGVLTMAQRNEILAKIRKVYCKKVPSQGLVPWTE